MRSGTRGWKSSAKRRAKNTPSAKWDSSPRTKEVAVAAVGARRWQTKNEFAVGPPASSGPGVRTRETRCRRPSRTEWQPHRRAASRRPGARRATPASGQPVVRWNARDKSGISLRWPAFRADVLTRKPLVSPASSTGQSPKVCSWERQSARCRRVHKLEIQANCDFCNWGTRWLAGGDLDVATDFVANMDAGGDALAELGDVADDADDAASARRPSSTFITSSRVSLSRAPKPSSTNSASIGVPATRR